MVVDRTVVVSTVSATFFFLEETSEILRSIRQNKRHRAGNEKFIYYAENILLFEKKRRLEWFFMLSLHLVNNV